MLDIYRRRSGTINYPPMGIISPVRDTLGVKSRPLADLGGSFASRFFPSLSLTRERACRESGNRTVRDRRARSA